MHDVGKLEDARALSLCLRVCDMACRSRSVNFEGPHVPMYALEFFMLRAFSSYSVQV